MFSNERRAGGVSSVTSSSSRNRNNSKGLLLLCSVVLIVLCFQAKVVNAVNCRLEVIPVEGLVYNRTLRSYTLLSNLPDSDLDDNSGQFRQRRNLRSSSIVHEDELKQMQRQRRAGTNSPGEVGAIFLLRESDNSSSAAVAFDDTRSISDDEADDDLPSEDDIQLVRECWCATRLGLAENFYCPVSFDTCTVSNSQQTCINAAPGTNFVRGAVPAFLFFLGCLTYAFIGSEQGAAARAYLYRKVCVGQCGARPDKDYQQLQRSVERLQERQPDRAAWLFNMALRRMRTQRRAQLLREERPTVTEMRQRRQQRDVLIQDVLRNNVRPGATARRTWAQTNAAIADAANEQQQEDGENGAEVPVTELDRRFSRPSQLELKTRIYVLSEEEKKARAKDKSTEKKKKNNTTPNDEEMDDEMERGERCAICLGSFEEGERVGDLSCKHVFHVDPCLKGWLKRKNMCPLCNTENMATAKYTIPATVEESEEQPTATEEVEEEGNPPRSTP